MRPLKDIAGQKFGRLTAIERVPDGPTGNKGYMWRCECDCGGETVLSCGSLTGGNTKSCGCYKRDRAKLIFLNPGTNPSYKHGRCTTANKRLYQYRAQAEKRGYGFFLTDDQFFELMAAPCKYCDQEHSLGVDRVDNNIGYTVVNSVPCCKVCNRMKNTHTLEYFLNHIKKILIKAGT